MKKQIFTVFTSFALTTFASSANCFAQKRAVAVSYREKPSLTYDISGASGSYNGYSYNEIHLGLNWYVEDWLNWRNSIFTRFGSNINTVTGLDTALLATSEAYTEGRSLGIQGFIGPGLRFANQNNSAVFGQAGVVLALGGLHLGLGLQSLYYNADRTDSNGFLLPKTENQIFIIISGGGVL